MGESIQGKADFTWQQHFEKVQDSDAVDKCNQEEKKSCIRLLEREKSGEGMEQRGHVWLPKELAC